MKTNNLNTNKHTFSNHILFPILIAILLVATACNQAKKEPRVEGHYSYEHSFNYDLDSIHLDVSETGTMDFYADSTALDSARQVYTATLNDGSKLTWVYNYISPSHWHLDGDNLYFAGIKDSFRMEVVEGIKSELTQKIADTYRGSIEYEYKFHIDSLTNDLLQWSFIYRDGHSDIWTFHRKNL